tara:strand:+ start:138 stop:296 length:159 start_codon:yes stop_codon:yes gene_type:complete
MSIYTEENIIELRGEKYERLYNHKYKYRIIFSDQDYDYVEDENLIQELNELF